VSFVGPACCNCGPRAVFVYLLRVAVLTHQMAGWQPETTVYGWAAHRRGDKVAKSFSRTLVPWTAQVRVCS
jgi:hypothetical protein